MRLRLSLILLLAVLGVGCHPPRRAAMPATQAARLAQASGLSVPTKLDAVNAVVVPPLGWTAEPLKSSEKHKHQIWLSPSRNTAYGVIFFTLPWPVGPDLALWGFLKQMKKTEGEATLINKQEDEQLPGMRFTAQGGLYLVRTNLIVEGFNGWAIYAGTVRGKPVDEGELIVAEHAREQTAVVSP